jgi:hypothetical protein
MPFKTTGFVPDFEGYKHPSYLFASYKKILLIKSDVLPGVNNQQTKKYIS